MTESTEAAVLVSIGQPLEIETIELPQPDHGQVLVTVAWSALCHTQLNEIRGLKGPDRYLPHTLGHEGTGIVEAIGPGVTKVVPGDKVVLTWIRGSGLEGGPTRYRSGGRDINSGPISTFMRRTVVSENRLVKLGSEIALREAALFGCALPTGYGMVKNDAALQPDGKIAVFGVGGVGLAAILGAGAVGASAIVAVDIDDAKLERARAIGATHAINARNTDPLGAIADLTGGTGLDAAVEASGATEAMEATFEVIRPGGVAVIAGNAPSGSRIRIDPMKLIQGKRIIGSWGGGSTPDCDIPAFERLYEEGALPLETIISHEFPLADINDAFSVLASGATGRVLIDMGANLPSQTRGETRNG